MSVLSERLSDEVLLRGFFSRPIYYNFGNYYHSQHRLYIINLLHIRFTSVGIFNIDYES